MYPVLFEFGPLKVYTWGLMVGIGILMGLWVVLWKAREALFENHNTLFQHR